MNRFIWCLLLSLGMVGCVNRPVIQEDTVSYYYGETVASSIDGRIPYNKTEIVMMRKIAGGGREIVEIQTHSGNSPAMPPYATTLSLTRRAETLVYDAVDEKGSPCGVVRFSDGRLNVWTYDLNTKNAGKCSGAGRLTEKGILISKKTLGFRPMSITEDLHAVSRLEYEQVLKSMRPPVGAE